ncbi:hypothetical protein QYE76_015828 [Lolium multiflorum]|uniref:DUF4283 domain-containing protein n=1 Tax=Lolium multiflorum TaxID=4521 RepID=A0AAD8U551_LOLMU|nr:hypothetical protein QYE76_015828 [Lolium multiflorum]
MDQVAGLMRGLKLSEGEMKGVKLRKVEAKKGEALEWQAIGKLMAEKLAIAGAMEDALGPLWCPIKGIECKDLGENIFLFTFYQASGKKKAVEEGPWTFDKSLLIMEEFEPHKNIDDYDFSKIPIWVRIFKLPLGLMNRATGEDIGDQIGEYVGIDGVENGLAVGRYLRIKVKLTVAKPLMRGTMVAIGEEANMRWCPFQYEFLPDFRFTCGLIGHLDKDCSIKLKKGEEPQYGRWLKWIPPKRQGYDGRRSWGEGGNRRQYGWSSGGSKSGSDGPSWKKDGALSRSEGKSGKEGEKEVTSPLKITSGEARGGREGVNKSLCFEKEGNISEVEKGKDGHNVIEDMVVDGRKEVDINKEEKDNEEEEGPIGGKEDQGLQVHGNPVLRAGVEARVESCGGEHASRMQGKEKEGKKGKHFRRRNRQGVVSEEKLDVLWGKREATIWRWSLRIWRKKQRE